MKVPYVNLGLHNSQIKAEIVSSIEKVLERGDFVLGREVQEFENAFAAKLGGKYAVGTNSGTDALILSLRAMGIGPGDEVITVPNSFIATVSSIIIAGATPVFVDVQTDQNIDVDLIEEKITSKTKAIEVVHLTGRPARMDAITPIAEKRNVLIIEDCAQAVLAKYDGEYVGNFGQAGCFSFHPLKNLSSCGDGGIVVTNDEELYFKLRLIRNHGLKNRNECVKWGVNSRLDTVQAAILLTKMKYLERWTEKRREIARFYIEGLSDLPVSLPVEGKKEFAVYHSFVIQTKNRDKLKDYLAERGIDAKIHYPIPAHLQEVSTESMYKSGDYPVAERLSDEILSLPIYPELTEEQMECVVYATRDFFDKNSAGC